MALIKCKECKSEISSKAGKCPSCGIKVSKTSNLTKIVLVVMAIFVIIDVISGEAEKKLTSAPASAPENVVEVSAQKMAKDYDQNEARADSIYKGKLIKITGVISSISKDLYDNTVVSLKGVNMFADVHAEINKNEESKAINLLKGSKIVMQCRSKGEVVKSPMLGECVIM